MATERTINMGPNTHAVPLAMFRENRERVCAALLGHSSAVVLPQALVLLQGGDSISLYNTDVEYVFRQEAFFMYHFGVREPGCFGTVNVSTRWTTLFVPRLPAEYATWMGKLLTVEHVREQYGVDEVKYVDEVSWLHCGRCVRVLFIMSIHRVAVIAAERVHRSQESAANPDAGKSKYLPIQLVCDAINMQTRRLCTSADS